ncbi:MAG TPA: TlpA disulfide reductase family protein [Anaerolineales bacterium]|nr:TlpA disulfide reductase family protein [Anaerolineales bacterium]
MSVTRSARRALAPALALGVILAACAPPTPEPMEQEPMATDAMMDHPTPTEDHMMEDATPTAEAMMQGESMGMPGFFSVALTDVASGTEFTLADFEGKVVLLEPFAQWCSTCLAQQREVVRLRQLLGDRDDFVIVGLDIDPNEDAAMLQAYLARYGFDWHYAVAPTEVAREIGDLYGSQYLNPPSAPMLVIDQHGEVHPLEVGTKTAEALQAVVEPLLDETM